VFLWLAALASGGPVLYGEGAVAHAAAIIARGGDPYGVERPEAFVAANYPPLAFVVAALGEGVGPFFALRLASIVATLGIAVAIAWRTRRAVPALALAASFVALFPVEVWGSAHKPDPLAMALTAVAVLAAGPGWRAAGVAGAAAALAVFAKPTSLLPLAAVFAYLAWREPRVALRSGLVAVVAAAVLGALSLARFDPAGMLEHIVRRNALPLEVGQLPSLILAALLSVGAFAVSGALTRDPRLRAYIAGAALVILLGAREGATINYFLDLAVASSFGLATVAARATGPALPLALLVQLVLGAALFRPLDPSATIGAWGDPRRVALAADLARTSPHLVEDSGVLVANGIDPVVDDLFLWSRLVAAGARVDDVTPRVARAEFATVIAEVPLDALDAAPGYERQRWPAALAGAVLASYRLDSAREHSYRYVPRRVIVRAQ
jgi:hypothetical protein